MTRASELAGRLMRLEGVARGIVAAQERTAARGRKRAEARELHAATVRLRGTFAEYRRAAAGLEPYEVDAEREALREAQATAERVEARKRRDAEGLSAMERQQKWNDERARILRERAKITREAEQAGQELFTAWPALPSTVPDWFLGKRDGTIIEHRPSVPVPVRDADGTLRLELGFDALTGRQAGPELLHPEEALRRQAEAQR